MAGRGKGGGRSDDPEKRSLRRLLLERRDNTSSDMLAMAGGAISRRLSRMDAFGRAKKVGAYYSIGSEIPTRAIIDKLLSDHGQAFLPRVSDGRAMTFRRITAMSCLERSANTSFDIMEPKDDCPVDNDLDMILVPAVGVSPAGFRLGYGYGFYDRFLASHPGAVTISPVLEKQIIRRIPRSDHDVGVDWIITEDRILQTRPG